MKKKLIFSYSFLAVLVVSLVVGVFAWFSLAEISTGKGASIVATSKGTLKIYPEVDSGYFEAGDSTLKTFNDLLHTDFVNTVDFALAPFKVSGLVEAEKSNISGDGETFYYKTAESPDVFGLISGDGSGLHKYIEFDLYFSGLSGIAGTKDVYLTGNSSINDVSIRSAVRVAFIYSGSVVGIWAPYGGSAPVFVEDSIGTLGTIGNPIEGNDVLRILNSDVPATATTLLPINTELAKSATQKLTVVMWIEGTDSAAADQNLGQEVELHLEFAMKP